MNGHGVQPPDRLHCNVSEFSMCEMKIKQEPIVKLEPEDDDGMVILSRSAHTVNGFLNDWNGGAEMEEEVCFDSCDLDNVKL